MRRFVEQGGSNEGRSTHGGPYFSVRDFFVLGRQGLRFGRRFRFSDFGNDGVFSLLSRLQSSITFQ